MLRRKDTLSGAVLEIEQYSVADNVLNIKTAKPKTKPMTDEQKADHAQKKSEKNFVRLVNANFSSHSYYVTNTYDNEHYPKSYEEAEKRKRNYMRRLKYHFPKAKIIGITGYGTRSGRLHHHFIMDGVNEDDIKSKWISGDLVRAERLKSHNFYNGIDHGEDFTSLAMYLHAHSKGINKGKRWSQTKNIEPADSKPTKEIKRAFSENNPPKAPKGYMYVGATFYDYFASGYINFKYVRIPADTLQISSQEKYPYHKK